MSLASAESRSVEDLVAPSELAAVRKFLKSKPQVKSIMLEGQERLASLFPTSRFEYTVDPPPYPKLRVFVWTKEPYRKAVTKFDSFRDDWWRQHWEKSSLDLAFHLRFG
jgi:hypothetical protein